MSVTDVLANFMSSLHTFATKAGVSLSSNANKLRVVIVGSSEAAEIILRDLISEGLVEKATIVGSDVKCNISSEGDADIHVIEGDISSALLRGNLDVKQFNILLALSDADAKNFLALALAKLHGVPIRVGLFERKEIARVVRELGLGTPIVRSGVTASFLKHVVLSAVKSVEYNSIGLLGYRLFGVTVFDGDPATGLKLGDLHLEDFDAHALMVFDGAEFRPALPDVELSPGNLLFILARDAEFVSRIKGLA